MKYKYILITLVTILFSGCKTVELESYVYADKKKEYNKPGIVYSLPKNILKVEITYTTKKQYRMINGIESLEENFTPEISIDNPIKVSSILVPDETFTYRLTGERISNDFFAKSTLDFNLTRNGILKSIDSDVEDESVEFGESLILTASNIIQPGVSLMKYDKDNAQTYDLELYEEIQQLNSNLIKEKEKSKVDLIISKIKHLEAQIEKYRFLNKIYFKSTNEKYTVHIDPFHAYEKNEELKTEVQGIVYNHTIHPTGLFSESIPKVQIVIRKNNPLKVNPFINAEDKIHGVVIRHPANSKIDLIVDENLVASEIVYLGQLGNISILPVKIKRGGKIKTTIKFDEVTGALSQHRIEATSSSEKIGKSLVKSSKTLRETIDFLKYEKEIKELQSTKDELQLIKDIKDIEDTEVDDLTKQEKIIQLQKRIDELNKTPEDNKEFEEMVNALQQQQKLLELEIKLKELQNQLNED